MSSTVVLCLAHVENNPNDTHPSVCAIFFIIIMDAITCMSHFNVVAANFTDTVG